MPRVPEGGLSQTVPRYAGGQLRFLRQHVGPSEIFGLGAVIPIMKVTLHYKGRSFTARAGLDTGATGSHVVVEPFIAEKLKMPRLAEIEHAVVGGSVVKGYLSELDQVDIEGLPGCSLKSPSTVAVTSIGMKDHDVLIGEEYLDKVGATISYRGGYAYVSCKDGPSWGVRIREAFSRSDVFFMALGGLIFLGFLISLVEKD